jgi:signal transduction histidine kinase
MTADSSPVFAAVTPHTGAPASAEELVLPRPPGLLRRFLGRHPWVVDWFIVGFFVLFMVGTIWANAVNYDTTPTEIVVHLAIVAGGTVALVVRRRQPLLPFTVGVALTLIAFPSYGQGNLLLVVLALYAVAVYRSSRAAWIGLAVSTLTGTFGAWWAEYASIGGPALTIGTVAASADTGDIVQRVMSWPVVSLQYAFALLLATLIGTNIGNRRRYLGALLDRAAQLVRERDQQATIAAAAERSRIAREMHDVVAHSLSIVVSLADGAAAIVPRDPLRAQTAMLTVGETGRQALAEMRRLLGVLGSADDTSAPLAPQPGLAELDHLIEQFRRAALPVSCTATGTQPTDDGVQLAIYRIVQESLTNALRYAASATAVTVDLNYKDDHVSLRVADDAASSLSGTADTESAESAPARTGRGIIGIEERAALFGGTATAGPRPGGGWQVVATIPLGATI